VGEAKRQGMGAGERDSQVIVPKSESDATQDAEKTSEAEKGLSEEKTAPCRCIRFKPLHIELQIRDALVEGACKR
jgi:hypothetical protein